MLMASEGFGARKNMNSSAERRNLLCARILRILEDGERGWVSRGERSYPEFLSLEMLQLVQFVMSSRLMLTCIGLNEFWSKF